MTEIRLALCALALVATLLGGWGIVHTHDAGVRAAVEAAHTKDVLEATNQARAVEAQRLAAQKEVNDEAQRMQTRARANTVALAAAAPGLRSAFAAACFRAGPSYPAAPVDVASTATGAGMLPLVSGEIETRLRALGAIADARRDRGIGCEAQYDSLK